MNLWFKLLIVVSVLMAITLGSVQWWRKDIAQPLTIDSPQFFDITPGSSGHQVLAQFEKSGLTLSSHYSLRLWLKFVFSGQSVKAGTYELNPGMTLSDAFNLFASGNEYQFTISFIEGQTLSQWLEQLKQAPRINDDISPETLAVIAKQWPWPPQSGLTSLEGVLLADTYHYSAHTQASALLARAMDAMVTYLNAHWPHRAQDIPYQTQYEALIMASIVEKETAVPEERGIIAGVFANRLEKNMRLQTDPTVIYGIGESFDGNLTRAHLKQKTAYNTYVIKGLPPTPIAMAGRPAIDAALTPVPTDALYFVAKGDGSHHFSRTLEEHNRAVYDYQIKK